MIGDFVTFKDCQHDEHPIIVKIWQINGDNEAFVYINENDALDEITIDDEIVGIPLTPEILEKNGFAVRREIVWRWTSDDERTSIRIVLGADYVHIIKNSCYEDEVEFSLPCPNVVHELQHALRLCGIDKEIVL